jgi:glycosyltransferase involved in cell wall biosynthesis
MTGPLPPAIGGMATVISDLAQSRLSCRVHLQLFNTGKTTPPNQPMYRRVSARLSVLRRWWKLVSVSPRLIVHIHSCSGLTYWLDGLLLLLARVRGHRTVLHIHGGLFDVFLDGLLWPLQAAARHLARSADRVIVLSDEWFLKLAPRLTGASLSVVLNGVPPISGSLVHDQLDDQIRILFLGDLCTQKGVLDLVRSMDGLPDHVHLFLAGAEAEAGFLQNLRSELVTLGLENRVHLLGLVTGESKVACLRRADLFVLPSYAEGLPISLLEAMAAGLPVVATRVGGIPAVLEDGKQGRLVRPGNVEELRRAIGELVDDATSRQLMGCAAYQRWQEEFNIERTVDELLAVYRSVSR